MAGGVIIAVVVLLGGDHGGGGGGVAYRCSWNGAGVVVSALIGGVVFTASVPVLACGGWHCHGGGYAFRYVS